ncbi:kinase-like protein [Gigaspora margarita]|uniref:Kinase-like protein n=1 Tax=Gigaspora margarita TaxID=4874 RepID=A0A8H3X9N3_GIGMA|nr:kinase-like protein [Gigaspora margarita]
MANNLNELNELIEKIIDEGNEITKINYGLFSNFEEINRGAFGTVRKATWGNKIIALKSLNIDYKKINTNMTNETQNDNYIRIKAFFNELQILADIENHEHPYIVQFHGITKDPNNNQYNLILQFAVDGNLREYLKREHLRLSWQDRLKFAQEIAEGLTFLHEKGIFHRDLHSKNILVHNQRMMIADFGVSKHMDEVTMVKAGGMYGYLEPQCFVDQKYKCDKRSDIYSFGVILWEISSGKPPFCNFENQIAIIYQVSIGIREVPIENTPNNYVELYQCCWDKDPKVRPEIKVVLEILKKIQSPNIPELRRNELSSSTLSRVKNKDYAIGCWENIAPLFGSLDLYMTENAKFWGCYQLDYEEPIKKNGEKIFEIKDYEVFQYL